MPDAFTQKQGQLRAKRHRGFSIDLRFAPDPTESKAFPCPCVRRYAAASGTRVQDTRVALSKIAKHHGCACRASIALPRCTPLPQATHLICRGCPRKSVHDGPGARAFGWFTPRLPSSGSGFCSTRGCGTSVFAATTTRTANDRCNDAPACIEGPEEPPLEHPRIRSTQRKVALQAPCRTGRRPYRLSADGMQKARIGAGDETGDEDQNPGTDPHRHALFRDRCDFRHRRL